VLQVFRERKGHQCTVRLAFTLDTQYRIGLLISQLLDSITNSRGARCAWTIFRVFVTEKRFVGIFHCVLTNLVSCSTLRPIKHRSHREQGFAY